MLWYLKRTAASAKGSLRCTRRKIKDRTYKETPNTFFRKKLANLLVPNPSNWSPTFRSEQGQLKCVSNYFVFFFKYGSIPAYFCLFSTFSNFKLKLQSVDFVLEIQIRGRKMLGADLSTDLWWSPMQLLKNGPTPAPFPIVFVFSNTHYKFYNKYVCEEMSIQYTVRGFEFMTIGTWVFSHNH